MHGYGHLCRNETISYKFPKASLPDYLGRKITVNISLSGPARFIIERGSPRSDRMVRHSCVRSAWVHARTLIEEMSCRGNVSGIDRCGALVSNLISDALGSFDEIR